MTTAGVLEERVVYHRYYDPSTGQFISVDPLIRVTGQPYGYAEENPVNSSDPSGAAPYCGSFRRGPCEDTGASRPEIGECYDKTMGSAARLCQHLQEHYNVWLKNGGANENRDNGFNQVCGSLVFMEICVGSSRGHSYTHVGFGIGMPGITASAGPSPSPCDSGPSFSMEGSYAAGGGVTFGPGSSPTAYGEVGLPGYGMYYFPSS